MSAMNGVLSIQHLSCSDKTLQYFLLFMFPATHLIFAHKCHVFARINVGDGDRG